MNREQRAALRQKVAERKRPVPYLPAGMDLTPPPKNLGQSINEAAEAVKEKPLAYRCGHQVNMHNLTGRDCEDCRAKKRKAKPPKKSNRPLVPRLPHGSEFLKRYSAETQTWFGQLAIPNGAEPLLFQAEAPGEHKLEWKLDDMYRAFLLAKESKAG